MYTIERLEQDIQTVQPRIFDTYILPPFMAYYAIKSKGMKKNARRMLFTAAVFMFYRNYVEYRSVALELSQRVQSLKPFGGQNV